MRAPSLGRSAAYDLRLAVRRLAKTPGWTLGSAATLALGLAACLVSLVLVRDVLLQPLPLSAPDRLVRILEVSEDGRRWWPSFPNAADWREHARMFEGVGIADVPQVMPVLLDGRALRASVSRAARGLFETLGVRPADGRLFTDAENRPGGVPVAIVSARFWRRELRSRPVGEMSLTIGRNHYTIVGVLPADFRFLGDGAAWSAADVWTPMDQDINLGRRTSHGYHVVARLAPGVSLDRARAEMNELALALRTGHREPTQAHSVLLVPLHDVVVRAARQPLRMLLYASGAVLLVACFNLGAGLLAQGLGRGRELSLRVALGATRARVAQSLVIEATALALPAAVLGLALAALGLRAIAASAPGTLPRLDEVGLDERAAAVAFGLAATSACLAGLLPALVLSARPLAARLRSHGTATLPEHHRLWTGFVIAQVTLTVLLLIGSGLLVRSFFAALAVDLGYNPRQVLAVDVALPESRYAETGRRVAFYDAALEQLRSTPGIARAGLTSVLPHIPSMHTAGTQLDGPDTRSVFAGYRLVDPGYFAALEIEHADKDEPAFRSGAVLVDRKLERLLWTDGRSPIGDRVQNSLSDRILTVAGVVGTAREWEAGDETTPAIYVDYHHRPDRLLAMHLVVRYYGDAGAAIRSVREALAQVDPLVPVTVDPLDARTTESLRGRRFLLLVASGFGLAALLLAAAGIYAMVAFVVGRQMRDAAIRLALGARPGLLHRRIVTQALVPCIVGTGFGLALAVPMGKAIGSQLFKVQPGDPLVLSAAAIVVVAASVVAASVPGRRVARVDPAVALRQD